MLWCALYVYLRLVSCVSNVTNVSGLFILDCNFGFLGFIRYNNMTTSPLPHSTIRGRTEQLFVCEFWEPSPVSSTIFISIFFFQISKTKAKLYISKYLLWLYPMISVSSPVYLKIEMELHTSKNVYHLLTPPPPPPPPPKPILCQVKYTWSFKAYLDFISEK